MAERPWIRKGSDLYHELEWAANPWPALQRFLNDLHNNGTPSEIEAYRGYHARLRDEIAATARKIYNELKKDQKRAFSVNEKLEYPGLARYN
jgi:hypothetical protein